MLMYIHIKVIGEKFPVREFEGVNMEYGMIIYEDGQ